MDSVLRYSSQETEVSVLCQRFRIKLVAVSLMMEKGEEKENLNKSIAALDDISPFFNSIMSGDLASFDYNYNQLSGRLNGLSLSLSCVQSADGPNELKYLVNETCEAAASLVGVVKEYALSRKAKVDELRKNLMAAC